MLIINWSSMSLLFLLLVRFLFQSPNLKFDAMWSNTRVGYVVGNKPFYMQLKACVKRMWNPTCSLEIHSRENGFFFFKFGDSNECDRVLQSGPWLFDGGLIVLKKWSEDRGLKEIFYPLFQFGFVFPPFI